MRRSIACTAVLAMFAFPAVSHADFVGGSGAIAAPAGQPNNDLLIAALSGPNGENPAGFGVYAVPLTAQAFGGEVQCLRVVGNRAAMVVTVDAGITVPPRFVGGGAVIYVEDNGPTPPAGLPFDRQQNQRLTAPQLAARLAAGCPAPIVAPRSPLLTGDLFVMDT
jgi:hypothetical protein